MTTYLNPQFPAARRPLVLTEDDDGAEIVRVTLYCGHPAIVDADDFHRLMALGLSPNWFLHKDGTGRIPYVRTHLSVANGWNGNLVTISRLIRPAPFRGLAVRYVDGCVLNLRKSNLYVSERRCPAKAREWSLVKSAEIYA